MKYYNNPYPNEDDTVWEIDHYIAEVEENESLIIEEQKRDYGNGCMWCKYYAEPIETGEGSCGMECESYDPCNGKSGRCRMLVNTMTGSGKLVKITCFNGEIKITELKES